MKFSKTLQTAALTLALVPAFATLAQADWHGYDHGRGHSYDRSDRRDFYGPGRYDGRHDWHDRGPDVVIVNRPPPRERVVVFEDRDYNAFRTYYGPRCGHGRCRPVYGRSFVVGQTLPPDVVYEEVPREVIVTPPPYGYRYVRVDNDVLLLDQRRSVVDIRAVF